MSTVVITDEMVKALLKYARPHVGQALRQADAVLTLFNKDKE